MEGKVWVGVPIPWPIPTLTLRQRHQPAISHHLSRKVKTIATTHQPLSVAHSDKGCRGRALQGRGLTEGWRKKRIDAHRTRYRGHRTRHRSLPTPQHHTVCRVVASHRTITLAISPHHLARSTLANLLNHNRITKIYLVAPIHHMSIVELIQRFNHHLSGDSVGVEAKVKHLSDCSKQVKT